VLVEVQGELNVRFGPGVDYPRLGIVQAGARFAVTRRHTQVEWVEIAYPGAPNGRGWVYLPAVKVVGDLNAVPITSTFDFGSPVLTPTPPVVLTSAAPWLAVTATPLASADGGLLTVSNGIYDLLLSRKFDPATSRQGSAFVLNLSTGQSVSINPGVAYSGMSLIKVPVMTAFYRKLSTIPTASEARAVAEMMVCSENLSSNAVLRTIGDGNPYRGAETVTETMRALGLKNSFLVGPFFVGNAPGQPTPTVEPVSSLTTEVDQQATEPDPFNQATPADLGWLLSGIYQCAVDGGGPLATTFPGEFTVNECRQMVQLMRANRVAALIGAGIPADVPLARKYGWVNEVHGDAALITSPGADYVLVVMLRNKTWLDYNDGFPLIAEVSRLTYNHFNPAAPLTQTNPVDVPACSADTIEPDLFSDLQSSNLPPIR
jgi:beta-lactamase class A